MTSKDLKNNFFQYFKAKKHAIIGSASLIPENDPSVLFITAGMQPLVPYLMGEKHPEGKRLANFQKCMRTDDIDEIGDTTHHTFFEMLGNWSLGDYFKEDTIKFSLEFLVGILKLNKNKLGISIFAGNDDVPEYDQESEEFWLDLGIPQEKICKVKDNWWGPAGETGPCGPDTEVFYWTGEGEAPAKFNEDDEGWVEIWNNVLMEYNKTADGKFIPLEQKNVDTGMGLERTLAVLNSMDDNYMTDLFLPIIQKIEDLSEKKYADDKKSFRIVADHIRSAVFILGDPCNIAPGNKDQGYVLRRLIRRAIRFAKQLGIENKFTTKLAKVVIKNYQTDYKELFDNEEFILEQLNQEESKFSKTLSKGLKEFEKFISQDALNEEAAFILFTTYGFPIEMTLEMAEEKGIKLDKKKYEEAFNKHQELSRTASAGKFKGGLADDGEMAKKFHTATHLLHQALRDVLGDHVQQKGSNINEQRLRFDFTHPEKMTDEEKTKVEEIVNQQIELDLPVLCEEMSVAQAKEQGAIGLFDKKYGEMVKVYKVGKFSQEICGGPHVKSTAELGHFKIKKEQSSSAGIRRIKAILE
ncbi:alanine--tRNA ligase [Candidatus Parcubacteria bacterium]|jgi:alanyl-tRNA synthetase|nr:alanine--tRNA ligase [Candidatus Parcubacteria bacterium]